ncbi:glycosyltransferase [Marinimicrobium sp. LS-A18]|uniref:glycosyltransferase n=1 Tax=Marinimicrobium sp. LS-A18 TaxID=1381596 RepID=UPI000466A337|nr:glycosyltransferase [Marinimicrobium sp. LS-A18]
MKVVHVIDSGGYYGAEQMLSHLCKAQIKSGVEVEVISIGKKHEKTKELENKLYQEGVSCKVMRVSPVLVFLLSINIIKYCRDNNVDVIHSHGYKGNILLGWIPKKLRPCPVITTVHGYTKYRKMSKLAIYYWLDKLSLKKIDHVVLVSEPVRNLIDSFVSSERLSIIHNGIPEISDNYRQSTPFQPVGSFKIGALGRLSEEKNFSTLIKAIPLIKSAIGNLSLVIHGEGPERENLEKLIDRLKLSDAVSLPGYTKDVDKFFSSIDVFINCSITEGMPISILEAMRVGVQIVASEIPANRYVLSPVAEKDYIVENSADSIADAVVKLYRESEVNRSERSRRYQRYFANNFTVEKMAESYHELYRRVIHGDR